MNKIKIASLAFATVLALAGASQAGPEATTTTKTEETWSAFSKGNTELELLAGYFWGIGNTGSVGRPDTAWGLASLRYGWMLNDPAGDGILRGNWEFLVGAYGGPVFEGPGSFHVGADLALRYNFVQPNATVVPYFQAIAGGGYSDAASDRHEAESDRIGLELELGAASECGGCSPNAQRWSRPSNGNTSPMLVPLTATAATTAWAAWLA